MNFMTEKFWDTGWVMKLNFRKEILGPRSSNFSLRNLAYWFQKYFEITVRPISQSEVSILNQLFKTAVFTPRLKENNRVITWGNFHCPFWLRVKIGQFGQNSKRIFILYNKHLYQNCSLELFLAELVSNKTIK